jgi:hypothetical protein
MNYRPKKNRCIETIVLGLNKRSYMLGVEWSGCIDGVERYHNK